MTMRTQAFLPLAAAGALGTVVLLSTPFAADGATAADAAGAPPPLAGMDCVVEPSRTVDIGAAVPGLLVDVPYDRGDFVEAGMRVAGLDDSVEVATLAMAMARARDDSAVRLRELGAALGERTRERNEQLGDGLSVSKQTLDQIDTETAVARLQVVQEERALTLAQLEAERARAQLDQRMVRTPIAGAVVERFASEGEYVDSDPVYRIAQLDPLHVEVIVPVDYLDTIEAGMGAAVRLQAPGREGQALSARVTRIDAVADPGSATYGVRLELPNPSFEIPAGVRCSVDFVAS